MEPTLDQQIVLIDLAVLRRCDMSPSTRTALVGAGLVASHAPVLTAQGMTWTYERRKALRQQASSQIGDYAADAARAMASEGLTPTETRVRLQVANRLREAPRWEGVSAAAQLAILHEELRQTNLLPWLVGEGTAEELERWPRGRIALRVAAGLRPEDTAPIALEDGDAAPRVDGEAGSFRGASGRQVSRPAAYGGKTTFVVGSRRVVVGRDWRPLKDGGAP